VDIAVTGGTGFIGQAVIDYAKSIGHEAWAFDHSMGLTVMEEDDLLEGLAGADVVIHLAGMLGTSELFDNPRQAVDINIKGTLNVLDWCHEEGAAYVGITMPDSSWANVYQATKLCAMRLATAWHRNFGVPVSHVRAFNVYGPGQKHGPGHPQKFLPTFATRAWAGLPLPVFGNGLQTIDPVWVGDVARMLVDATGFGDDEIFDAGTGTDMTVRSFARLVNRMTGNKLDNLEFLPMRPGEEPETAIRAKGEGWDKLGWQPEFSPAHLEEAINWYRP
jgi:nucleoside-diphosphate-sugar epimerase